MEELIPLQNEVNARTHEVFPVDWNQLFQRSAPLVVEIGCGNGEFLTSLACRFPDRNFIGIELSLASAYRVQARIFHKTLSNVRIIRDDAKFAMRELFADKSVREVIMNFPDPWPKERHKNRRLIQSEFVTILAAVLEMNGTFELFTDQRWYADDAQTDFAGSDAFQCSDIEINPDREVTTKYERKWKQERRDIYHFRAVKKENRMITRILEINEMPHFFIQKEIANQDILKLKGFRFRKGESVFTVKEIFQSPEKDAYLLRIAAVDRDYLQTFFLLVARHEKNFIVKIDAGFQPYRTPAVKLAVEKISNRLEEN